MLVRHDAVFIGGRGVCRGNGLAHVELMGLCMSPRVSCKYSIHKGLEENNPFVWARRFLVNIVSIRDSEENNPFVWARGFLVNIVSIRDSEENNHQGFWEEKVHVWPSNYRLSLVLAIELENQTFLTIQLSKPFKFGHRVVLIGGFQFFYLQFSP
jgi:hypothetical protein